MGRHKKEVPVVKESIPVPSKENKTTTYDSGAIKHNKGKIDYSLVSPVAIRAIASVLTHAANSGKYEPRNWEAGINQLDLYSATMRHLEDWRMGYDIDPEDGLPLLDKVLTNVHMMVHNNTHNKNVDDRVIY